MVVVVVVVDGSSSSSSSSSSNKLTSILFMHACRDGCMKEAILTYA